MMDKAILFGSLDLALVEQGDEVFLFEMTDKKPKPVTPRQISLILHSGAEYRELTKKGLTIGGLRTALRDESDQQRALNCAISAIDRRLSDETRVISIEQLDRHLSVYMKRRFLENRLLGRPVPDGADIKGALALTSQHGLRVGRLLEEMERLKRHIDTFYKAWRESVENLSAEDKETILWLLVEHGVVAQIARSLAKTDYKGLKAVLEGLHGARFSCIGTYDRQILINNLCNTLIPEGGRGNGRKDAEDHEQIIFTNHFYHFDDDRREYELSDVAAELPDYIMDNECKSADAVRVPQHYYEEYVSQFAYFTYEATSSALDAVRLQFDIWLSAEQFVATIMGAAAKTMWGRSGSAVVTTGVIQSVSAAVYAQRSVELAWHMWESAGALHDRGIWEYWRYAQNHVLALTKHTIQAATSGTSAAQALRHFFNRFSPQHYLDEIRKRAYFFWEQRGCPEWQALDDWLRAESKILDDAEIASIQMDGNFGDEKIRMTMRRTN